MRRDRQHFLVLYTLLAVPSVSYAQAKTISLLNYSATVPTTWTPKTPSSSMRLAEYSVAGANGTQGADVVVYYFGAGQGGSTDANLARWKSQFTNPDGGAVFEKISHDSSAASPLTIAEYRGTYARGIGMGSAPEAARPNNTLIAVVAETPHGTLFFQMFGATAAVEAARASYLQFARSLK